MNHALSLTLELLEQEEWGLRFRLTVRYDSAVKLLLPFPQITELNFGDKTTRQVVLWGTRCTVSARQTGLPLLPGGFLSFEWRVRSCSIEPPPETPGEYSDWDYGRWCVDLKQGEYLV